jgi:hypothetical protein
VLSGGELKCLLYIVRRTLGFKKDADAISLSQMVHGITTRDGRVLDSGTGLNRSTVVEALASLEARGLITVVRASDDQGAALTSTYALRWRDDNPDSRPSTPDPRPPIPGKRRAVALDTPPATVDVPPAAPARVVGKSNPLDRSAITVVGKTNYPDPTRQAVVGKTNQGGRKNQPGWSEKPPGVVGESNSQQTGQETESNDDSNRAGRVSQETTPPAMADPPPYSPYIAGVILDHSRELGDATHGPANVTQALRLWQASGAGETAFVALLHEARRLVRVYQGKQGPGGIQNRMAYFFRVLADLTKDQST